MPLDQESIEKFKKIYKEEVGEEIDDQMALELAQNLLNLFKAVYKPIPFEKKEEFEELRNPKKSIRNVYFLQSKAYIFQVWIRKFTIFEKNDIIKVDSIT